MKKIQSVILLLALLILLSAACTNIEKGSLEKDKLARIESMLEIQNVIAAYAMAWDQENTQDFANHFTEDAIIIDSWHGKETQRYNGVQEFMDARGGEGDNVGGHTLSLVHFKELNDSTASTQVVFNYFWYGNFITNDAKTNIRGLYIDEWMKTDLGWRIVERIIEHENVPAHRAARYGFTDG